MIQTREFDIKWPEDVGRFFFWLVFDCKINFHPNDSFSDYVNEKTKERMFTDEQCYMYDRIMDECFNVCGEYGISVYEIAIRVMQLYQYCDGNKF